jgi:SAM-dependent methyltransferase
MSSDDRREAQYRELMDGTLPQIDQHNRRSADIVLRTLLEYLQPASVLDVGCGLGTWLLAAKAAGIQDVQGVEATWFDRGKLAIDPSLVHFCDLEQPFSLGRRFDLAICIEVAEHLSPEAAPTFVASLVEHSDVVYFSAAIPHQGGTHHVNERFPDYWANLFEAHGYRPVDLIRPRYWLDLKLLVYLRQQSLLYVHDRVLQADPRLAEEHARLRMLSVVNPHTWIHRAKNEAQELKELRALREYLLQGGTFSVAVSPDGKYAVNKV